MGSTWEPLHHQKRHSEFWSSSISSLSLASLASLSSLSTQSVGPSNTGDVSTITGGIATITSTYTSDGSTIVSTFTTTSAPSNTSPTSTPDTSGSLSQSNNGPDSLISSLYAPSSSLSAAPTPTQFQVGAVDQAVCAGQGLDTQAIGVLTTLIFSAAVGFIIWAIFAILRPRVRALYGCREWFLSPGLRPPALSNGLFAFLHPPVPLVPSLASTSDMDDAREARVNPQPGQAVSDPAQLFASDEQLAQRTLWIVFLICLVWSIIALAVALPIYLVNTPCLPNSGPETQYGGRYGTLNDLSLLRLLRMLDDGQINGASQGKIFWKRLLDQNGKDLAPDANGRLIAICVIMIVLGILPILWKLWKEFTALAAYYKAWDEGRCERYEIGYLSAGTGNSILLGNRGGAWGWRGWGEGKVKAFFRKAGLGGGSGLRPGPKAPAGDDADMPSSGRRRRNQPSPDSIEEKADAEVNVTSVFSVGDTTRLARLIDERDIILDNLEVAETRYISSFQPITPSPSPSLRSTLPLPAVPGSSATHPVEGHNPSDPHRGFLSTLTRRRGSVRPISMTSTSSDPLRDLKNQISRPRPLKGSYARSRKGYTPVMTGPTYPPNLSQDFSTTKGKGRPMPSMKTQTKTPTTYLAPSQYYKLNGVKGVSGGKLGSESEIQNAGRSRDGLNRAGTGTKFIENTRDSTVMGKLPLGTHMMVDEQGVLSPADPTLGPNHPAQDTTLSGNAADEENARRGEEPTASTFNADRTIPEDQEMVFVDDASEIPHDQYANPSRARPRPPKQANTAASRDTFPMRPGKGLAANTEEDPPHLRLQAQQPFHRPITGLDHDALGAIYTEIRHWRGELKAINKEIADVQETDFQDLAEGRNIKGWILVGKGLRFLPGIEMIEGRSKEDIRWDELQRSGGVWSDIAFWIAVCVIGLLLGAGLLACAGLAISTNPDVVHYLPFLSPVVSHNNIPSGLATGLAPAVGATIFVALAMFGIHRAASHSGAVSITVVRIKAFKAVFWVIVIVAGMWLVAAGSLLFGAGALDRQQGASTSVANGSIATALLLLLIIINVAIIVPGLLLLQPVRLWKMHKRKRRAITPRQEFRAMYPKMYNPVYAMGCCILGIVFVSAFALLFPLIGPAVLLLVFLTLIAHRFLIGYVYGRTDSGQTGGLLQLWVLRRFATMLALQPLVMGLVVLSRQKWVLGGIMIGTAVMIIILVEWYCTSKLKKPGVDSLSPVTRDALEAFARSARPAGRFGGFGTSEKASGAGSDSDRQGKDRHKRNGSISSVLDMMSITLAVMPGTRKNRPPVPLPTEHLDDLIATERAARTHPNAPPHLPPLNFVDHAEEMSGILYPPELTAPPPVIWLPNDSAGIARSEAYDLQHYHHLSTVIDVRAATDVSPRHSSEARRGQTRPH
ncbi:hypothetical protein M408DRAFT_16235 [Serendipita vermifera MAFF 305830]|uniref:CSC1/OSCA1-like 7TM region domain-containing protein n=1 Tax=Serendipita vermifera MAFF 305830 TaxID=933852 RepID=A0A0C3AWG4_SERVB|nr:hypothetical protein M408DRAFT_16235 [Serendipita vermifera MAFF 305830]